MIIWIASYPKSGNTYLRSFISSYYFSKKGKFDFDLLLNILQFPSLKFSKKIFKLVIDRCATSLLRDPTGYKRDSIAEAFEAWTVHSYAGDYNPLHSHGCHTPSGLSMIFYLKVPKCIEEKPSFPTLHNATGDIDGHTGLITSTNTIADVYRLKLDAQEYIKPKKGFMIIFPNWLQHCVMPFFGEGERRTMSANFNIRDSKETFYS